LDRRAAAQAVQRRAGRDDLDQNARGRRFAEQCDGLLVADAMPASITLPSLDPKADRAIAFIARFEKHA
jgi:hypothetical protein